MWSMEQFTFMLLFQMCVRERAYVCGCIYSIRRLFWPN